MASRKQQDKINQLKFLQSQLAAQQAGLPGFATPQGKTMTPAEAAAAGAPVGMAAQFAGGPASAGGTAATLGVGGAIPGAINPGSPQGMNRAQKLAGLHANVAAALKKPSPGTGKTLAALATTIQQPEEERQFVVIARQLQRLIRMNGRRANDVVGNLSIPGDVWFPVLVLLVLLVVIVPIAGADGKAHTRLGWLWMVLTGQAHVVGEMRTAPVPASGVTTSGSVPAPGQQNPYPGALGSCDCPPLQQPCANAKKQADGTCDCCQPIYPGGIPIGAGTEYRSPTLSQPLYTGNATLGAEDYL